MIWCSESGDVRIYRIVMLNTYYVSANGRVSYFNTLHEAKHFVETTKEK